MFELGAEDANIVKAPDWPKALLAEFVGAALLENDTVVAVPPQVRTRIHFKHRNDIGLIALQTGHRQIVKAIDKGRRFREEPRLVGVDCVVVAKEYAHYAIVGRTQTLT